MSVREGSNNNSNPPPDNLSEADSSPDLYRKNEVSQDHHAQQGAQPPDVDSMDEFPSLTPSAPCAGASASILAAPITTLVFSDSFIIEDIVLSRPGRTGTPPTLSEVIERIELRIEGVKLEAGTQCKGGRTRARFAIKAETERAIEDAKRMLRITLTPTVTRVVQAPVSTVGIIIGRKGENLH